MNAADNKILPLQISGLCLDIGGRPLLHAIDMMITANGISLLLGPNGAGKTLLLETIHGLRRPTAGSLQWSGPLRNGAAPRQTLMAQAPVLLSRSALGNICYALPHLDLRQRKVLARESLQWAGIADLAQTPASRLSIGQQQVLALARARAMQPELLLMDEPTANLDPGATRRVEKLIQDLAASGTKVLMSTHNLAQARRLAEEVFFIAQGRLVESGSGEDFFRAPTSDAAQLFIQSESLN